VYCYNDIFIIIRSLCREWVHVKPSRKIVDNRRTVYPRAHCDFKPILPSWLDLVERWFGEIAHKRICRGVSKTVSDLVSPIEEFIRVNNANPKLFVWTKKVAEKWR
jgi:hypothetical protein